jgi:hypothetical protein
MRPPRTSEQLDKRRSAGYRTDIWTLGREAELIADEFGVRHHPAHVWKILTGLELPEAGAPHGGMRRGRDRAVEAWGMAADKKTPRDVAPISCSSMRAASCSSRTSAGRGRPAGRPRACATATATIACRCAAVPSTCCGIAAPSIDVARYVRSRPTIPDFTFTTFRRTRRGSIQPSTYGPGPTTSSPMLSRTSYANSVLGWPTRRADCVVSRPSSGPASTRPT